MVRRGRDWRRRLAALGAAAAAALSGCASDDRDAVRSAAEPLRPADARARIAALLPATLPDRAGWAADIHAAFAALRIAPTAENACAVAAVAEQESSYRADPTVPNLGRIARDEIDRRADRLGVPAFAVGAALALSSPNGRSWGERIDAARTEQELSRVFDDLIGSVPLGKRLFADWNPVRTGGPMQVGIAFAQRHAVARPYPYSMPGTVRDEVFTRRGGLYFGIAHLLDYPAAYDRMLYRFADFNAGQYASRNAAFQNAVSLASGIPLTLDGDLIDPQADAARPGPTEAAVRVLSDRLGLDSAAVRRALERGATPEFERTALYERTFALAERIERKALPRAVLPRISLQSPKITRKLTTEWFAQRVDERHARCLARAQGAAGGG